MPILILLLTVLISSPCFSQAPAESPDQLWEVGDRRWTVEEEQRYARWVEETITEDFFLRHRIPTDCADAVYGIRWIYARIARLPAAATTTDGRRIGHWSTDWKHLPTDPEWDRDDRFRAALRHLFPRTWTGTLPQDTYPVRVAPDSVKPGTLFLVTESHTGIIGRVFLDGSQAHPLLTWESALPVKVQKLSLRHFFSGRPDVRARSGLVRFRWPVPENGGWTYLPAKEHPFYSEEQYAPGFTRGHADFVEAVARRIDPADYSPLEKTVRVMGTVTRLLRERGSIVLAGYEQCRHGGCPEGSELWETYSTPGRDGRLLSLMDHLSHLIESTPLDGKTAREMMEAIPIEIAENRSITLYQAVENHPWFSPHPEDSIEARWGLEKCEMIHAQTRATQASIAFVDRAYRKKDPRYADFAIRQQQHLLGKLRAEWSKSECREPAPTPVRMVAAPERTTPASRLTAGSLEARGGLKRCETIRLETRATHDAIAFIEKTYRKKDPVYADFAIRQQQHELGRLVEEGARVECKDPSPAPVKKAKK